MMAYALTVAKYAVLVALAFLFWIAVGHGHSWVFAAVMLAAIRNHYAQSLIRARWRRMIDRSAEGAARAPVA